MENEVNTMVEAEQTSDSFLAGWDDEESLVVEESADQQETETQEEVLEASTEETPSEAAEEASVEEVRTEDEVAESVPEEQPAPKLWTLRHMDEEKQVNESEMVVLAQKGMDYDRIRAKYDEAKPAMEMLAQFAKKAGVSTAEYITAIRAQAKQAEGMSEAEAKRAVDLEDREARVAVREAEENARVARANEAATAQSAADQRRAAEIAEFQKTFPEAAKDPKSIPPEVWAEVKQGVSLVGAYAKYAIKNANAAKESAQREAASAKQNNKNAERSTGSMKSAGEESKSKDPFLKGWDD